MKRRHFLLAAAAQGLALGLGGGRSAAAAAPPRVVIVGGGWGGLAAARALRELAPEADVSLIERQAAFWSGPLSNRWLVGQLDERHFRYDYQPAARSAGYRFIHDTVTAIDRERRRVVTGAGAFDYDWLILAAGIRHDYAAWFGDDATLAERTRTLFPAAYTAESEYFQLRERLTRFKGGDWLMTIPPAPFRCMPAPYERAVLLAGWFAARKLPARIVILDPNPPAQDFVRIFREFGPQLVYHSQVGISAVDPIKKTVQTEFEAFGFDEAILMPPQQAAEIAWQAGLIGRDGSGRPSGWAKTDPLSFASVEDERIFIIGDMIDRTSPIFGHYPKTAQMAVSQGRLAAKRIAALLQGRNPPPDLPGSLCHVTTRYAPPEAIRIEMAYRLRGDGAIMQQAKVNRDAQPRGEDLAWLQETLQSLSLSPP